MKYSILVFSILFVHAATILARANDYLQYYQLINQAELKIVQSSYAEALGLYEFSFSKVEYVFAKDAFNAATCAYLINDYDKAFKYITESVLKGVDISNFQTCVFEKLQRLEKWRSIVALRENLKDRHFQSINLILRREIDLLHARDQKIRFDHPTRVEEAKEKIANVDYRNLVELLKIFEEYGVTGEDLIGVDNFRSPTFYILWHNYRDISPGTMDMLKKAVLEGRFDRYDYSRIASQKDSKNTLYGSRAFFRVDKTLYVERYSDDAIKEIDRNRREIGLEPHDELKMKVLFSLNDQRFRLQTGAITRISFANEDEKIKFINNLIPLTVIE